MQPDDFIRIRHMIEAATTVAEFFPGNHDVVWVAASIKIPDLLPTLSVLLKNYGYMRFKP